MLGSGGMGQVFLALNVRLNRDESLKILNPGLSQDLSFQQRFEREARLAASIDHPNVVAIYQFHSDSQPAWMAMQYIEGSDAETLIRNHPGGVDPQLALDILTQAARGIDAAHARDLLHRDVKPANLLISQHTGQVKVTDFGIAKALGSATEITGTGFAIGTIAYMAPEVLRGQPADQRSDIYALGCTFYALLTGRPPFLGDHSASVMYSHVHEAVSAVTSLRLDLPEALDHVISKALAKNPQDRYQSCGEFAAAAEAALQNWSGPEPATAAEPRPATRATEKIHTAMSDRTLPPVPPPPARQRVSPKANRTRVLVIVAAVLAAVIAVAGGIWWLQSDGSQSGNGVAATVEVGLYPWSVAVDPAADSAYVTNYGDGTISVIDLQDNSVATTIEGEYGPMRVAVNPTTNTAYVTNYGDTVSVIDTRSNTITATIPVGKEPAGVAVDATTNTVYVTNVGDGTVSVIDARSNIVTATIPVGKEPGSIAVEPGRAYITNNRDATVWVIDTRTNVLAAVITVGNSPRGVAIDSVNNSAYVSNYGDGTVSVIDTRTFTVTATIAVGNSPVAIAVDPGANTAYVANSRADTVSVIDTRTNAVTRTIEVADEPAAVTVNATTHKAYVASYAAGVVSVIDGAEN